MYVDAFFNLGVTSLLRKTALEQFHWTAEDVLGITSLEAQDSVSDVASSIRLPGDVPDAVVADDGLGAVLDVDDDWNLGGAVGVYEFDKRVVKRHLSDDFKSPAAPREGSQRTS